MFDIAIIGGGPAGLSAAVNVKARNKSVAVFMNKPETSAIYKAEKINNHLGMPDLTGKEMLEAFLKHAKDSDVEFINSKVSQVMDMGHYFSINANNEFYSARAIIFAVGVSKGKKLEGEEEFLGKGVSYCATCDGMLYRNRNVFVLGSSEEVISDIKFLSGVCSKIYYLPTDEKYRMDFSNLENVNVLEGKVQKIVGENVVKGIYVDDVEYAADAVFIISDSAPPSSLIYGLELSDKYIKVNEKCETNLKGVYACGDCVGLPLQVSNAIGEGLVAGQNAARYTN